MLNEQSVLDARNLITGKDGQLFITTQDGNQLFLAEVDTFSVQLTFNNVDYQPIGSDLVYAVPTGKHITLTFTEALIRDDVLLEQVLQDMMEGYVPYFDFTGKLSRRDGQTQRQVFRNCIPDGNLDLMSIKPGEIVKRQWNFKVNSKPELMEQFKTV